MSLDAAVLGYVRDGERILDVGGQLGVALQARGNVVHRLEAADAAEAARLPAEVRAGGYDAVVLPGGAAPAPAALLSTLGPLLVPGGRVIVALPDDAAAARARAWLADGGFRVVQASAPRRWPAWRAGPRVLVAVAAAGARAGRVVVAMISYNEEQAIGPVLDEIHREAPEAAVVVVDSSKDRTAEIAAQKGATVIRQVPARGYGPAMEAALSAAAARGDVVVTMDCDGTYPAAAIGPLARLVLDDGWDLVNATRLGERPKTMPLANWMANASFAGVTRLVHGLRVSDVHSGMRAYRASMLRALRFKSDGPALPVELLIKPARLGYRVTEVPIEYRERIGTTTLHRFSSTVWTFRRIFGLLATGGRVRAAS